MFTCKCIQDVTCPTYSNEIKKMDTQVMHNSNEIPLARMEGRGRLLQHILSVFMDTAVYKKRRNNREPLHKLLPLPINRPRTFVSNELAVTQQEWWPLRNCTTGFATPWQLLRLDLWPFGNFTDWLQREDLHLGLRWKSRQMHGWCSEWCTYTLVFV